MRTRVVILLICLLTAAAVVARADRYEQIPPRTTFDLFPMKIGGWSGEQEAPFSARVLEVLGLDDYVTRAYFAPDRAAVGLYIGYWKSQRTGDTIHSPQNCLPGAGWEPTSQRIMDVPDVRTPGATVPVNRLVIQKGLDKQLVIYWYQAHGRIVASEYWSKFYLVTDAVRMNRTDGAIVRLIAPVPGNSAADEQATERTILRFLNDLLPQLDTFLPL
jgi:EpsI family protein